MVMKESGGTPLPLVLFLLLISVTQAACNIQQLAAADGSATPLQGKLLHMKLVDIGITDSDLDRIRQLGFSVLNGEWGIGAITPPEMVAFLDRLQQRGLKFVVNLAEGAAWGYPPGGSFDSEQPPVWQGELVKEYLERIRHHPAIYAYDISNEAGENLPNGARMRITLEQLYQAAADVRFIDGTRPILIRMHYWDDADGDFSWKNPFGPGIADIVMLNLYSNYSSDGIQALLPNMVRDSGQRLVNKILAVDHSVRVWISLAAFRDKPHFLKPTMADIRRDVLQAASLEGIDSIGFFGWGSPQNGAGWYLPREGAGLLDFIRQR